MTRSAITLLFQSTVVDALLVMAHPYRYATDTMTRIEHVNFGWLHKPPLPPASCHCLMVQTDTGIGMHDIDDPQQRIGREAIDAAGFKFLPVVTAIRQLQSRGIDASGVTDIV